MMDKNTNRSNSERKQVDLIKDAISMAFPLPFCEVGYKVGARKKETAKLDYWLLFTANRIAAKSETTGHVAGLLDKM